MLRIDEVHVLRAEAHRLPVEAAFEQEGPAGMRRALEALLQLGLEAVELLWAQVAVAGGVDEGAALRSSEAVYPGVSYSLMSRIIVKKVRTSAPPRNR